MVFSHDNSPNWKEPTKNRIGSEHTGSLAMQTENEGEGESASPQLYVAVGDFTANGSEQVRRLVVT